MPTSRLPRSPSALRPYSHGFVLHALPLRKQQRKAVGKRLRADKARGMYAGSRRPSVPQLRLLVCLASGRNTQAASNHLLQAMAAWGPLLLVADPPCARTWTLRTETWTSLYRWSSVTYIPVRASSRAGGLWRHVQWLLGGQLHQLRVLRELRPVLHPAQGDTVSTGTWHAVPMKHALAAVRLYRQPTNKCMLPSPLPLIPTTKMRTTRADGRFPSRVLSALSAWTWFMCLAPPPPPRTL